MRQPPVEEILPLMANLRFVRFAGGKFFQLIGQNALVYGLFILVVRQEPSSLATSAFILTSVVPSILLSLPGGVVADAIPAKATILGTLLLRMAIIGLFLSYDTGVTTVLLLSAVQWSAYQFYTPGENAALPSLVRLAQMAPATALLHGLSLLAQMAGAGLLAPVALKVFDADGLFSLVLLLFAASLVFFTAIPRLTPEERLRRRPGARGLGAVFTGMRIIREHRSLQRVTIVRVIVDTASMMLVVSLPVIVRELLRTAPENTVYIVAPGAIGIGVGLVTSTILARISLRAVLWTGFVLLIVVVLGLVFLPELAAALDKRTFLPLSWFRSVSGISREIATTALLLPFAGLAVTFVQVAARAAVYEQAPPRAIAQVFATQSAIGSVVALIPTILAGLLLDLFNVRVVLGVIEVALVACLIWSIKPSRVRPERLDGAGVAS